MARRASGRGLESSSGWQALWPLPLQTRSYIPRDIPRDTAHSLPTLPFPSLSVPTPPPPPHLSPLPYSLQSPDLPQGSVLRGRRSERSTTHMCPPHSLALPSSLPTSLTLPSLPTHPSPTHCCLQISLGEVCGWVGALKGPRHTRVSPPLPLSPPSPTPPPYLPFPLLTAISRSPSGKCAAG